LSYYKRLSFEEREEISRLIESGSSFREIALKLNRNVSTISRDISRFSKGKTEYRAILAQKKSLKSASKRKLGKRKLLLNQKLQKIVLKKLKLYWSPDQIAIFLKNNFSDKDMHISADTIYTYIYVLPKGKLREELVKCLRREHKKRRIQGRSQKGQTSNLAEMISIEERPLEVADRSIPGHWEGDLIIGDGRKQTALGTLVERTTRTVILVPLKNKSAIEVRKAFAKEIKKLPKQMRLTLTYDQGREMAQHKLFTKETEMQVYFAHPKSPWERGTNENTNGLIRQFFPKGTDFTKVTRKEIKRVQDLLNGRPRRTLDYRTPFDVMNKLLR
jgi:IS30 family transposase